MVYGNELEKKPLTERHREGDARRQQGRQADQFHALDEIVIILSFLFGVLIQSRQKELERRVDQHEASRDRLRPHNRLQRFQKVQGSQERSIPLDKPLQPLRRARNRRGEYRSRRRDLPERVGELQTRLRTLCRVSSHDFRHARPWSASLSKVASSLKYGRHGSSLPRSNQAFIGPCRQWLWTAH